jgi:hypothetical protein
MALSDKKRSQLIEEVTPLLTSGEQVLDVTTGVARVKRWSRS